MLLLATSAISYLIGSIPFGLLLVYIFLGKNLKNEGSGNIGTTNVLRVGGKILALLTLILDSLKGFIIAAICKYFLHLEFWFIPGFFAVIGHIFPIWLKFKGGKGVATSLGFLLAINPLLFFLAIVTWLLVAFAFKYSSLAALITFVLVPAYAYYLKINYIIFFTLTILTIIIIIKHKSNIIRLIKKQEDKIKLFK